MILGTYHLYYGDEHGSPGTILTFFPWQHVAPGRVGVGQTQETAFRVPESAIGYSAHRFVEKGVPHEAPVKRFGRTVLTFKDLRTEWASLSSECRARTSIRPGRPPMCPARLLSVASEGVTLMLDDAAPTGAILTDVLGFRETDRDGSLIRHTSDAAVGGTIDIRAATGFLPGRMGGGSVHHVAFRAADDATQAAMVKRLAENHDIHTTEQKDRNYFGLSISASPAASCSRSPPTTRASRRMSRSRTSGALSSCRPSSSRVART